LQHALQQLSDALRSVARELPLRRIEIMPLGTGFIEGNRFEVGDLLDVLPFGA
jgi:hypothetical protein